MFSSQTLRTLMHVSILVLMDAPLEFLNEYAILSAFSVSILVLMDAPLESSTFEQALEILAKFQSLF